MLAYDRHRHEIEMVLCQTQQFRSRNKNQGMQIINNPGKARLLAIMSQSLGSMTHESSSVF
jgi:hypothetical protein